MARLTVTARDLASPAIRRVEQAMDRLEQSAERAGQEIDEVADVTRQSSQEVTSSTERVNRAERDSQRVRQTSQKEARALAQQELMVSQIREQSARATRQQADAERDLNNQRRRAGGGGAGGGGDGRDRRGGLPIALPGERTTETTASTRAINEFERFVNEQVRDTTQRARRAIRDQNRASEQANRQQIRSAQQRERDIQAAVNETTQRARRAIREQNRVAEQANRQQARNAQQRERDIQTAVNQTTQRARRAIREQNRQNQAAFDYRRNLLRQEAAEQRRVAADLNRSARLIEVGLLELFFTFHSIARPVSEITNFLEAFTAANIEAGAEVEKFAATLRIASGDTATAGITLRRLLDITTDLAAIDTASLIEFSSRLQTAGFSALQAERSIVAVTRRMEEQGKAAFSTRRVLEQLVQAVNANLISMQDFRPILREYPLLYRDFSAALGTTITDLDSFRAAANEVGGAANAIAIGLDYVSRIAEGADINTINFQLEQLRDRFFVLRSELGDSLRPVVVGFLRNANSLLEIISGLNEATRVWIGTFAIMGVVIGRVVSAFIQLGIIAIVTVQISGAITQISSMTTALNAATVAAGGTATSVAALNPLLARIARWTGVIAGILPRVLTALGILAVSIPTVFALYNSLTRQTRLAAEEYNSFVSIVASIPDSFSGGTQAIEQQINRLQDYREQLIETRAEVEAEIEAQRERERFVRFTATDLQITGSLVDPRAVSRLEELNRQIELTEANVRDLGIAFEIDVSSLIRQIEVSNKTLEELEIQAADASGRLITFAATTGETGERFQAMQRIMARFREELNRAIDDENIQQARDLALAMTLLADRAVNLNESFESTNIRNYAADLIDLDFAIRRLEGTVGRFETEDFVDSFGQIDERGIRGIERTFERLRRSVTREAETQVANERVLAKERETSQQELDNNIRQIKAKLALDIENLNRQEAGIVDEINQESSDRRVSRITRYLNFEQAAAEARQRAEELVSEAALKLSRARTQALVAEYDRRVENEARIRTERNITIRQGIDGFALLDDRVTNYYLRANNNAAVQIDLQSIVRNRIRETSEITRELTDELISQADAFRRISDETERFQFARPEQREDGRRDQIPRRQRRVPLDTGDIDDFEEQAERAAEIQERIEGSARNIIRANNRIINRFSRGFSRAFVDLLYDGEATFTEFLREFAKTTTQIIIQERISAELRKRIDTDLTNTKIVNIQRVAAEQARAGVAVDALTSAQLSSLSPVTALTSGGIGTVALIGLAIAPFLVNAIKEGFEETEVNIDGKRAGRITSSNIRSAIRRGEIRQ